MTASISERVDEDEVRALSDRLPDESARTALVELCRPLALGLARRFVGRGESFEDLAQVASLGLVKAVENFDDERGGSFIAYAAPLILGELQHHLRDRSRLVRLPRRARREVATVHEATDRLTQRLGRSPTVAEIADDTGLSRQTVLDSYMASRRSTPARLEDLEPEAVVSAPRRDEFAFVADWVSVAPALEELPDIQRRILYLRFDRGMTQSSVAAEIGVSQVHVSRLLDRALTQLRRSAGR